MKLKTIIFLVLVLSIVTTALLAQTLPVDSRKKEMQFHKSYSVLKYSPAGADTLWRKITLPANTVEVLILPVTGAIGVRSDSLYTNNSFIDITAGVPLKLPTYKGTHFYLRRTAAGTASVANIIFYKM